MAGEGWCVLSHISLVPEPRYSHVLSLLPPRELICFHSAATSSWKEIQFGEANVQVTFHKGETATIGNVACVMVEPDIDYFKDLGDLALCEAIPNALAHSFTDLVNVYVLRWIAARMAGVPEFVPRYTVTS